jgi:hypothetical protein
MASGTVSRNDYENNTETSANSSAVEALSFLKDKSRQIDVLHKYPTVK